MLFQRFAENIISDPVCLSHVRNRNTDTGLPEEIKETDNIKFVIMGDANDRMLCFRIIYGRVIRHGIKGKRIGKPFP